MLGGAGGQVESNLLAELGGIGIDLGDDEISDAGSPDSKDIFLPVADVELGYTFRNGKTRIALSNDTSDPVHFDRSSALLLQHDFENTGSIQASLFSATAVETRVWADPYLFGTSRDDTELAVSGARLVWDKIIGTGWQVRASFRERDLDDERSGEALGLSDAARSLLDRNGNILQFEVNYPLHLTEGHSLRPHVRLIDRDLDGDAMAQDGVEIGLSHTYTGNRFIWQAQLAYAALDAKEENPIFIEDHDVDRLNVSAFLLFPRAFGWQKWMPTVGLAYGEEDSNIDFYDSRTWIISAAVMRQF